MARYAKDTSVPVARSKGEIENTLKRYGASGFFSAWEEDPPRALVGFKLDGRMVKLTLDVPRDVHNPEQVERQHWRVLLLVVKAKLEAVECGISTIEREFMADIVMHNGQTLGDWAAPQLKKMYELGRMPPLLLGTGGKP